jgi:hypothetical protein
VHKDVAISLPKARGYEGADPFIAGYDHKEAGKT